MSMVDSNDPLFQRALHIAARITEAFERAGPRTMIAVANVLAQYHYPDAFNDQGAALDDFDRMTAATRAEIIRIFNGRKAKDGDPKKPN